MQRGMSTSDHEPPTHDCQTMARVTIVSTPPACPLLGEAYDFSEKIEGAFSIPFDQAARADLQVYGTCDWFLHFDGQEFLVTADELNALVSRGELPKCVHDYLKLHTSDDSAANKNGLGNSENAAKHPCDTQKENTVEAGR